MAAPGAPSRPEANRLWPAAKVPPKRSIFDIGRVLMRVDISRAMDGLASWPFVNPILRVWFAIQTTHLAGWQRVAFLPGTVTLPASHQAPGRSLTFEQFQRSLESRPGPQTHPLSEAFLESFQNARLACLFEYRSHPHVPMRSSFFPSRPLLSQFRMYSSKSAQASLTRSSPQGLQAARSGRRSR